MSKLNANHLFWMGTRAIKTLRVLGVAGLVMILGCGLVYGTYLVPLTVQIKLAEQQLAFAKTTRVTTPVIQTLPAKDMLAELAAFEQLFPQANTLHDRLGLIDKAAFEQGLKLNRGDYKLTQIKQEKTTTNRYPARYEIVLPVTGQYTQIRQFIGHVLQVQPTLALSSVKIQRDNVSSPSVDARLVFVLFLQGESL